MVIVRHGHHFATLKRKPVIIMVITATHSEMRISHSDRNPVSEKIGKKTFRLGCSCIYYVYYYNHYTPYVETFCPQPINTGTVYAKDVTLSF